MPVNATGRKYFSELIKGMDSISEETAIQFNFASVTVGGSGTISPLGTPVIWDNADSRFEVYVAQDIATVKATGGSPLPNGSVVGILVGDEFGHGFNKADLDLTSNVTATVLYNGKAGFVDAQMEWGTATSGDQDEFKAELGLYNIIEVDNAEAVTPSYV